MCFVIQQVDTLTLPGVPISKEAIVLASISYQCLFRLYQKLAGMTGTAWTEKDEFESIYDLKAGFQAGEP